MGLFLFLERFHSTLHSKSTRFLNASDFSSGLFYTIPTKNQILFNLSVIRGNDPSSVVYLSHHCTAFQPNMTVFDSLYPKQHLQRLKRWFHQS